jgi:hypothetical protein
MVALWDLPSAPQSKIFLSPRSVIRSLETMKLRRA